VLTATATLGASALAGCTGSFTGSTQTEQRDAITLTEEDHCDVCGMVIPNHPGPSSEIFYADSQPNDHANPARFDSTWEAFKFDFAREDWTRQAFFVTDYSSVEYELITDGGQQLISRHVDAASFVDAQSVTFVVGSEVVGTMGDDLIAFSDEPDANAFSQEYGGDLVTFDDVTPTMISQLGK
jgi:nitrous oxide reductase accessory protein NosL